MRGPQWDYLSLELPLFVCSGLRNLNKVHVSCLMFDLLLSAIFRCRIEGYFYGKSTVMYGFLFTTHFLCSQLVFVFAVGDLAGQDRLQH